MVREWYEEVWRELPEELEWHDVDRRTAWLTCWVDPEEAVLDLGCGDGAFSLALIDHGAGRVVGMDVAEEALRRARDRAPQAEFRLTDVHGPFPAADGEFDVVWAGEVIEHVADTERWVNEVRRVLRPGGRLLLSTPYHGRLRNLAIALFGFERHFDPRGQHLRFYTRRSLRALLEDMGFTNIHIRRARATLLAVATRR